MLRERGEAAAADALEGGSLADLITSLRAAASDSAEFEQRLAAIFATEQDRVANASALAELLLPLLSNGGATPIFGVVAPTPPPAVEPPRSGSPSFAPPTPTPPVRRAPGDIADFLDDMIAQEQAETAPDVPHRRAS